MKRFTAIFLTIIILMAFAACGMNQLDVDSGQIKASEDSFEDFSQLESTTAATTTIVTTTEPESSTAVATTVATTPTTSTQAPQTAAVSTTTRTAVTTTKAPAMPVTTTRKATTTTRKAVTTTAKAKPTTTVPTTAFDVQYWVNFAKNYALGLGMIISEEAKGSWDTPLAAGPTLKNTERDIKDRISRYQRRGYDTIWIWAKKRTDNSGKYDLYVGYG